MAWAVWHYVFTVGVDAQTWLLLQITEIELANSYLMQRTHVSSKHTHEYTTDTQGSE